MSNRTAADISQQMEKVESLLNTSKRLLQEGKMVDLSALEDRIRELSDSLNKCDPETSRPFIEPVNNLIDSLEGIETSLINHQKELEIGQSEMERKKARNAYQNKEE